MSNLFARFVRALPSSPLLAGLVISSGSGSVVVELPGGSRVTVRGEATPGDRVFIRNGAVEGPAPALSATTIDV